MSKGAPAIRPGLLGIFVGLLIVTALHFTFKLLLPSLDPEWRSPIVIAISISLSIPIAHWWGERQKRTKQP